MRLFNRTSTRNDLIGAVLAVLLLLALVRWGGPPLAVLRVPLGLALVLFLPGYTLQAALFPRRDDLDRAERLALSFGLSLALVPLVALLLDRLPWGIRLWPVLLAEGGLTLFFALAALLVRLRLPERAPAQRAPGLRARWASLDRGERRLYALLAGTLLVASVAAGAILLVPGPANYYTEFYMLGEGGLAEAYPRAAAVGEELQVTVGIASHERAARLYHVKVHAQDPADPGKPQVLGEAGPFPLRPGEKVESAVTWRMPWPGEGQAVELLLFVDGRTEPYRTLRLWINVIGNG